jgi:hypothetical protein
MLCFLPVFCWGFRGSKNTVVGTCVFIIYEIFEVATLSMFFGMCRLIICNTRQVK